jgi:ribose 5-phosphate isomerase B
VRIAIGSDHAGFFLKGDIAKLLEELGHSFHDFGTYSEESADYPEFAIAVAEAVAKGEFERGILICGTGIGMSIAANKVRGIRAALCHDVFSAKMSREHNDANVLCLGAKSIGLGLALEIVKAWLEADFSGEERHLRRLGKVEAVERYAHRD